MAAADYLARATGLPKVKIKDAMNKGALRIGKSGRRPETVRRAKALLRRGDKIEFSYDEQVLALVPPALRLIADEGDYSVWYKPAGLMSQGTKYSDHCSLLRLVEIHFENRRKVYPVHRLDREASGLVITAHTKKAAALLSGLFSGREVEKVYRVQVRGVFEKGEKGRIDAPLDGKEAVTLFEVLAPDKEQNISTLSVRIETGRKHQIRRHLAMAGRPVLGDPAYGTGNKNREGMRLTSVLVRFTSPFTGGPVTYTLPDGMA